MTTFGFFEARGNGFYYSYFVISLYRVAEPCPNLSSNPYSVNLATDCLMVGNGMLILFLISETFNSTSTALQYFPSRNITLLLYNNILQFFDKF